jgi:hypothetical protein
MAATTTTPKASHDVGVFRDWRLWIWWGFRLFVVAALAAATVSCSTNLVVTVSKGDQIDISLLVVVPLSSTNSVGLASVRNYGYD